MAFSIFERDEWLRAVDNLKAKATEFMSLMSRLRELESIAQTDPQLKSEYDSVSWKANLIRGTIDGVTKAVDSVYHLVQSAFGSNTESELQGLGLIPLVPIVAIIGATTAIVSFIPTLKGLLERLEIHRLVIEGVDPTEAARIVKSTSQPGMLENVSNILQFLAIGGFIFLLLKRR